VTDRRFSPLGAVQHALQSFVLRGTSDIHAQLGCSGRGMPKERLQIYAEGYRFRLIEALAHDFPALHRALGPKGFGQMGRAYIEAFPSRRRSVRWHGESLATFLRSQRPFAEQPWLSELAAFEWALSTAFDAGNSPAIGVETIAALPPEAWPAMRLVFHPSVQRLDVQWNVAVIRKSVDEGRSLEKPMKGDGLQSWVVWRPVLEPHFRSLEADEAWAVDAAWVGQSFQEICEGLCEWLDAQHVSLRAAGLLKGWATDGLISQVLLD
jgi:hypothetical protein